MTMIVLRLLSLLGLKSRWHRHFSPRPLDRVVFSGGRGVGGFVDSWLETLVPSASNRSTPEWTLVDSCGLPPRAIRRSNFGLVAQPVELHRVVADELAPGLGRDVAELVGQELLAVRPDAVG